PLQLGIVGDRNEGSLYVREPGDNALAVGAEQLELTALGLLEQAFEPEPIKHRLRQPGGDLVENRLWGEQVLQRVAGDAIFAGQRDAREERGARGHYAGI